MAKKTELIGFNTSKEVKNRIEQLAEQDDRTISYIINKILEEYLRLNIDNQKGE